MLTVRCEKYPELSVYDLGVTFHKGVAEVKNKSVITRLKSMKEYEFTFEKESESELEPEPEGKKEE